MRYNQIFLLIGFLLLYLFPSTGITYAQRHHENQNVTQNPDRKTPLQAAVAHLIESQFPPAKDYILKFSIKAFNDISFDQEIGECMANVAVTYEGLRQTTMHAILHIHYSSEGVWLPKRYSPEWTIADINSKDWKTEWCDFIRAVYPNEIEKQECR